MRRPRIWLGKNTNLTWMVNSVGAQLMDYNGFCLQIRPHLCRGHRPALVTLTTQHILHNISAESLLRQYPRLDNSIMELTGLNVAYKEIGDTLKRKSREMVEKFVKIRSRYQVDNFSLGHRRIYLHEKQLKKEKVEWCQDDLICLIHCKHILTIIHISARVQNMCVYISYCICMRIPWYCTYVPKV